MFPTRRLLLLHTRAKGAHRGRILRLFISRREVTRLPALRRDRNAEYGHGF